MLNSDICETLIYETSYNVSPALYNVLCYWVSMSPLPENVNKGG